MTVIRRIIPGVARVHAQVVPFAQAWQVANAQALTRSGPLWVVLGDSMSQGIGAPDISQGWVGQLQAELAASAHPMRLVNLSVTGARVGDVLTDQLPRLRDLGIRPDLVTVLIGANDMLTSKRRTAAVHHFRTLLDELASYDAIVATLPRRNTEALAINALIDQAAATQPLRVADLRGRPALRTLLGGLAEDHFHPNARGYAGIATAFAAALGVTSADPVPGPASSQLAP